MGAQADSSAALRSTLVRGASGLMVLAAAAVLARLLLQRYLDPPAALALLRSVQEHVWAVPVFWLAYLLGTALFLPAVVFHVASGAAWGFGRAVLLNLVGINLSASIHFLLARRLGRKAAQGVLDRYRLLALFDGNAIRHGFRAVLAIRLLPLPHMAVNVTAGVSSVRWRDFALGSAIGSLPNVFIYSYFASSLVEGVAGAERKALLHAVLAGAGVLAASFLPLLYGRLRVRAGP